jgi:hypothetical protein
MSFVTKVVCAPSEMVCAAAGELQGFGLVDSVIAARDIATFVPVRSVMPAAANEILRILAMTATHFVAPAARDRQLGAQPCAVHDLSVTALVTSRRPSRQPERR